MAASPPVRNPDCSAREINYTYNNGSSRILYDRGTKRPYPDVS